MLPSHAAMLSRSRDALDDSAKLQQEHTLIIARTRTLSVRFKALNAEISQAREDFFRFRLRVRNRDVAEGAAVVPVEQPSQFLDAEILEDRELLSALNAQGFDCDQCGRDEALVAVVRFAEPEIAMGLCGDCYRDLKKLSRGEVV